MELYVLPSFSKSKKILTNENGPKRLCTKIKFSNWERQIYILDKLLAHENDYSLHSLGVENMRVVQVSKNILPFVIQRSQLQERKFCVRQEFDARCS